jgi:hypothetical protein
LTIELSFNGCALSYIYIYGGGGLAQQKIVDRVDLG